MVHTGVRRSEGNRDYYNVCKVTGSRGETLPNLATRLRKLNPDDLCSEAIVDLLSSFPDGTVFACWDLKMVKVGSNKAPVVRYEMEDMQIFQLSGVQCETRWSLCHQIQREQDIKKQQSLPRC